jgi:hypothetical protein
MSDKIYCGNGKEIQTKHGSMFRLSLNNSDIEKLQAHVNKAGWVNLNMSKRKEVGKHGDTHYLTIDTWKPEAKQEQPTSAPAQSDSFDSFDDMDEKIPF